MTRLWHESEPVETWGEETTPDGFVWQGLPHRILEVGNHWRVHTRWWAPGQAVWREYYRLVTDTGYLCQVYHDLVGGGWFLARVYD